MFRKIFAKKPLVPVLDELLNGVLVNKANNYKDEAQKNYKAFLATFEKMKEEKILTEKQLAYYEEKCQELEEQMKDYTHKDQKPNLNGYVGNQQF